MGTVIPSRFRVLILRPTHAIVSPFCRWRAQLGHGREIVHLHGTHTTPIAAEAWGLHEMERLRGEGQVVGDWPIEVYVAAWDTPEPTTTIAPRAPTEDAVRIVARAVPGTTAAERRAVDKGIDPESLARQLEARQRRNAQRKHR